MSNSENVKLGEATRELLPLPLSMCAEEQNYHRRLPDSHPNRKASIPHREHLGSAQRPVQHGPAPPLLLNLAAKDNCFKTTYIYSFVLPFRSLLRLRV